MALAETRVQLQAELQALEDGALGALDLGVRALEQVMAALAARDVAAAEQVVLDDDRIDGRYLEVHQGILSLLARQAPVATDLRVAAALLHVVRHAERIGDQCVNVAKLIPLDGRDAPAEPALLARIARMGEAAGEQIVQARVAFARRDVALARDLVRRDDEIDRLNRECFGAALALGDDPDTREWAMHMLLVARALERAGDYAVDVGEQTAFVVTGLFREFEDASHV